MRKRGIYFYLAVIIVFFQYFECFVRSKFDLLENDIRLVFRYYFSGFISHEIPPVIYYFKDLTAVLSRDLEFDYGANPLFEIKLDDISMKNNLFVRAINLASRFEENSFFSTKVFTPDWDNGQYYENFSNKTTL